MVEYLNPDLGGFKLFLWQFNRGKPHNPACLNSTHIMLIGKRIFTISFIANFLAPLLFLPTKN
uniref:Uncharacterized protein n=1 Tax=Oryza brachyantha TaxID=4533 RepID=J3MRZ9_ORYBR